MEKGKMRQGIPLWQTHSLGAKLANHYSIDNLELKDLKTCNFFVKGYNRKGLCDPEISNSH